MKTALLTSIFTASYLFSMAQLTPFEQHKSNNVTATYQEAIAFYRELDAKHEQMQLLEYGPTDIGKNLNLIVLSKDKIFSPDDIRRANKRILLINNGIHPGEPEGIDASMMLARDMLSNNTLPKDVVICIIPVYNIDGMLNRGTSRANQLGPDSYGFRGNYQNLDLNRDFIKTDSKNSRSFQEIFNIWQPEVFVDNHTSNGADYQYIMTLIHPQKDKLDPVLSEYASRYMIPDLYKGMKDAGFEMIPYVNSVEETPDAGITGFLEVARYSTGYAALHNTIGFMPETHMLKPFAQRVASTYQFMVNVIKIVQRDSKQIGENKKIADDKVKNQKKFSLQWSLKQDDFSMISFKGFEAKYKNSGVSGQPRLYYDRNSPYQKDIKVWDKYIPSVTADKPVAYIIPQAWSKIADLLTLNGVQLKRLNADSEMEVQSYYIEDYKSPARPFEGHYLHTQVKIKPVQNKLKFYVGDYVVYANQKQNRYIVETLEPQGADSFFAWNFFDSVLGQKEHFSAYVFEDDAAEMLSSDPALKSKFEAEKTKDPEFSKNADAQLNWLYKNSPYYEKTYLRYPVGKLTSDIKLEVR
ncbi:M14 family zinc carboxypeptidase [Daejeonella lutea]|uniref:Zinc carboxypeptidase n=1 Tax=Daejeonella lutea TaxID=572036 RepID=A0A1T5DRM9_9SPHI|nr:M14 family zinc carboxypeptidase [Daejeonella lutea]SKB74143.1 Zinc carboxypeptidase [Daejeonella lutea]